MPALTASMTRSNGKYHHLAAYELGDVSPPNHANSDVDIAAQWTGDRRIANA
jgi:hypothetical protein